MVKIVYCLPLAAFVMYLEQHPASTTKAKLQLIHMRNCNSQRFESVSANSLRSAKDEWDLL